MKKNGFYGIGIEFAKTKFNYGTLFRTAQIFEADFIFLINARYDKPASDTMKSYRHLPLFHYNNFEDFNKHRPYNCKLIGIELIDSALELKNYKHPKQACYLLGAEDIGLSKKAISNCQEIIKLPGERSLNVSVAGSIILYDRLIKNEKSKS